MYAWEAIEQSLTFIGEHLTEDIYTEELANMAGLSPFYFQRLFKRLVNKPVQEYVKLRRLVKVIEFDSRIRSAYRIEPYMDYSRCSMQPGRIINAVFLPMFNFESLRPVCHVCNKNFWQTDECGSLPYHLRNFLIIHLPFHRKSIISN